MINADGLTTDERGNLMQLQRGELEGGDSLNWTGHKCFLEWFLGIGGSTIKTVDFFIRNGGFVRYPDPAMTNNGFGAFFENIFNGCISRDQFTGKVLMLLALISSSRQRDDADAIKRIKNYCVEEHLDRYLIKTNNVIHNGQNPYEDPTRKRADFTGPDIWALLLRLDSTHRNLSLVGRVLLHIIDTQMFLNTVLLYTFRRGENDLVSYTGKLIASMAVSPTLVSKLTWCIAPKKRLRDAAQIYWDNPDKDKTQRYQPGMVKLTHAAIDKLSGV